MSSLPLHASADECCRQFKLLIETASELDDVGDVKHDVYDMDWVQDQFARFKMWAGNIGAFADGHASLDYRLRDHLKIRQLMLNFLIALADFVRRAIISLKPDPDIRTAYRTDDSVDEHSEDETSSIESTVSSSTASSFQGTETESVEIAIFSSTSREIPPQHERLQNIEKAIDRLYRLSLIIRQPSRTTQNERLERYMMKDEEGYPINDTFATFARRVVDHQFPKAPELLRVRLANGILVRRKYFHYRQQHANKLVGLFLPGKKGEQDDLLKTYGARTDEVTTPTSPVEELWSSHREDAEPLRQATFAPSQTTASAVPSQPLHLKIALDGARSSVSRFSAAPLSTSAHIDLPRAPKLAAGRKEFECPYCHLILPRKESNPLQWRRHILEDLQPYMCIFEDCSEEAAFFGDRSAWLAHLQSHLKCHWRCRFPDHPPATFSNEEEYLAHMRKEHHRPVTEAQLPLLAKLSKISAPALFQKCPLCSYVPSRTEIRTNPHASQVTKEKLLSDRIVKHLAVHLESLAAKALPWKDDAAEESDVQSWMDNVEDMTDQSDASPLSLSSDEPTDGLSAGESNEQDTEHEALATNQKAVPVSGSLYEDEWWFIMPRPYVGHARDPILQPFLQQLSA